MKFENDYERTRNIFVGVPRCLKPFFQASSVQTQHFNFKFNTTFFHSLVNISKYCKVQMIKYSFLFLSICLVMSTGINKHKTSTILNCLHFFAFFLFSFTNVLHFYLEILFSFFLFQLRRQWCHRRLSSSVTFSFFNSWTNLNILPYNKSSNFPLSSDAFNFCHCLLSFYFSFSLRDLPWFKSF